MRLMNRYPKLNYKPSMNMTLLSPGIPDTRLSTSAGEHHLDAVPMMNSTAHFISPITFRSGLCFLLRGKPRQTAPFIGSTPATCSKVSAATPQPAAKMFLESCLEQALVTAACTPEGHISWVNYTNNGTEVG